MLDCYFAAFAQRASQRLGEIGFETCKGGVMPLNEKWRGSLEGWKTRIEDRLVYEKGLLDSLDLIILSDARFIYGNAQILDAFLKYFFKTVTDNKRFMKDFIRSAVLMPSALGFFGNFKVEKEGEHKDKFNLKLLGWTPLILSVRMMSLANGIHETNTLRRIALLGQKGIIKKDMEKSLADAYFIFVRFKLMSQMDARKTNKDSSSYLKPDVLGPDEQENLRRAMRIVEYFQKYMQETLLFGQPT